jgi:hypothetical protein
MIEIVGLGLWAALVWQGSGLWAELAKALGRWMDEDPQPSSIAETLKS